MSLFMSFQNSYIDVKPYNIINNNSSSNYEQPQPVLHIPKAPEIPVLRKPNEERAEEKVEDVRHRHRHKLTDQQVGSLFNHPTLQ